MHHLSKQNHQRCGHYEDWMMLKKLYKQLQEILADEPRFSIEEELQAIRQRNEDRAKAAIAAMGEKWVGHPNHAIQRIKQ